MTGEEFGGLFKTFSKSAFRLETLDRYDIEEEAETFRQFLAGESPPPAITEEPWLDAMRELKSAGKKVQRVHVIRGKPLTAYLRYEFEWGYTYNVDAGEEVFILDTSVVLDGPQLPDEDFWLFDEELLVQMVYDEAGRWLDARTIDDIEVIAQHCRYRDAAIAAAEPFVDYYRTYATTT